MSAAILDGAPCLLVNGQTRPLGDGTLAGVLEAEAANTLSPDTQSSDSRARGVAVAVNGQVVPRRAWDRTRLEAGDEIEIVKLFAGG